MKKTILFAAIAATIIASCKKDENKCDAGTGGNVEVVAFPQHHGKSVRPYHAYVKFNSKDYQGTSPSSYDLALDADTTENHIELGKLKCGDYYIYMTGYDTAIAEIVVGGIPYTVSEDATGELDINIPVVE